MQRGRGGGRQNTGHTKGNQGAVEADDEAVVGVDARHQRHGDPAQLYQFPEAVGSDGDVRDLPGNGGTVADGDARAALNAIELAVLTTDPGSDGKIHVTLEVAEECIQKKAIRYDKTGDNHYDTIAAFIESMCGSDPDAALYYLARMLEAGEDVKYIARRMLVAASEEVGNADPMAICVAASAAIGVERVGMPEGRIILAQAASYIASAPKSNSAYLGIEKALSIVRKTGNLPIPSYLQDSSYKGAKKLGRGIGYKYAHNYPNHWVKQQYLPDEIREEKIYEPNDIGHETDIKAYFRKIGKDPERYAFVDPSLSGKPWKPWEDKK